MSPLFRSTSGVRSPADTSHAVDCGNGHIFCWSVCTCCLLLVSYSNLIRLYVAYFYYCVYCITVIYSFSICCPSGCLLFWVFLWLIGECVMLYAASMGQLISISYCFKQLKVTYPQNWLFCTGFAWCFLRQHQSYTRWLSSCLGERTFTATRPHVWNGLPLVHWQFRRSVNTFLFGQRGYNTILTVPCRNTLTYLV